ncbi:MAG: hypothetical protein U9R08_00495 [Nanoarchaeota archaeon]|nr:hypothetical protein [Nanoarchaeota archaeon]
MAFFDFLKKHKEPEFPFNEPRIPGENIHEPSIESPPQRFESENPMQMPAMDFNRPPQQNPHQREPQIINKDLELISAKLDGLRATLDAINQRLTNIERIASGEKHEKYF